MERMEKDGDTFGRYFVALNGWEWCVFDTLSSSALPVECFMSRTAARFSAEVMARNEELAAHNAARTATGPTEATYRCPGCGFEVVATADLGGERCGACKADRLERAGS